jgi:mercuric reductase
VGDADRIKVYDGRATLVGEHAVSVDGRVLEGEQILLATGTRPTIPPIPGLDGVSYLTSDLLTADEQQELFDLPRSLVIVGGGYIALELGQMFHRFGSEVTILERGRKILKDYEPEVSIALTEALCDEGLNIVTDVSVQRVYQDDGATVVVTARDGLEQHFRAERLLIATGRAPNTDDIGIDKAKVEVDKRGFVRVDEELRTSVPNIWAAGDVIGRHTDSQLATPVGAHDGGIAASNALNGERRKVDHTVVPRTIFTDPQVRSSG